MNNSTRAFLETGLVTLLGLKLAGVHGYTSHDIIGLPAYLIRAGWRKW